mmetsp:Transcript_5508/g.13380  ORF Transcript_5508/g.13380 Transcript_5508/m.13380 type:complete len:276 (-) Transcript_5508:856-1683(-)
MPAGIVRGKLRKGLEEKVFFVLLDPAPVVAHLDREVLMGRLRCIRLHRYPHIRCPVSDIVAREFDGVVAQDHQDLPNALRVPQQPPFVRGGCPQLVEDDREVDAALGGAREECFGERVAHCGQAERLGREVEGGEEALLEALFFLVCLTAPLRHCVLRVKFVVLQLCVLKDLVNDGEEGFRALVRERDIVLVERRDVLCLDQLRAEGYHRVERGAELVRHVCEELPRESRRRLRLDDRGLQRLVERVDVDHRRLDHAIFAVDLVLPDDRKHVEHA